MVLLPTETKLINARKRILRTRALRYEIRGLLLRIERLLEKCIQELESEGKEKELGRELIVFERRLKVDIAEGTTTTSGLRTTLVKGGDGI
jgi:hypothetical protein